ncbi:efflux transporter periplasmic adaptor subunit [Vibrio sp. 10N.286.55.E10]|uniref:efflux RND transporter periplasmic adaptor subunit n=1 Tax=unclassified Vibrio TaxID=2614977 RepID=UPI000C818EB4|nr:MULTISPECIES: efflux RND transporter periplasmic adaptor subunit [unclassified Vibrio]PME27974.1 efflux transporter periplasmic adaptor subunit [Vibrio sp. 10N.286.55.E12]PME33861.1 efflux transporter periplasmic adaptor subunit [Vibrio sp. 10N.286.55.E10]PME63843.1 efflux transporter periplasmic adaptor subunit [Vibrio sp. 10N.286.55.C11]
MNLSKLSVVVASALLLQACNNEAVHREQPSLLVSTFEVGAPLTEQFRSFNGQVMPAELTPLAFKLSGEIQQVLVEAGDNVEKGQLLATLDNATYLQDLTDAKSQFKLASKQLARGTEMFGSEMLSQSEHDQLTANYKLASANLAAAKRKLSYTELLAPFPGTVSTVDKQRFENTAPGETLLNVYQNDKVYVRIQISDSILASISPEIRSNSYRPEATFGGHTGQYPLTYLEHTSELHPQSRTYEFWMQMQQPESEILPGTSVTVNVDMAKAGLSDVQGYQLPMTTLQAGAEANQFYVWKMEDGQAFKSEVEVDKISGQGALIAHGVEQGELLVNSNLRKLRDGIQLSGKAE